jgi:hypothetical protein
MGKLIYHMGTGTYFDMDDDVYVIDMDEVAEPVDDMTMELEGDSIAAYWGRRIADVITVPSSGREAIGITEGD